ncbi:hypothetical protein CGMCC3_g2234 [Colletotrichum fructicola]|nr:uncharacterized protein CGMCC3_g2234 [Colletotrichum fructicola]KAE9582020.1 hypothetical protein CGMCC3_g2234 [Colletotrichum fructicola]
MWIVVFFGGPSGFTHPDPASAIPFTTKDGATLRSPPTPAVPRDRRSWAY